MKHHFSIKLNLDSGANQGELIQLVKSGGGDAIQTSDGLCVKTDLALDALKELLASKEITGVTIEPVDLRDRESLSKDVLAFIG